MWYGERLKAYAIELQYIETLAAVYPPYVALGLIVIITV
jgi:hypothetical protein